MNPEDKAAKNPDVEPVLYVLMRTDLPDYVPGKSMAQSNHAGTKFCIDVGRKAPDNQILTHLFKEWTDQSGDGFGTCVVLGVTRKQMHYVLCLADIIGLWAGMVHDPSYPIVDGDLVNHMPVDTCGYVFGRKHECARILRDLSLF